MLSLSINELFFTICWDLSPYSGFLALVKRISHLSARFNFSRKNIQGLARAGDTDRSEKYKKIFKKNMSSILFYTLTTAIKPLVARKKLVQFFDIIASLFWVSSRHRQFSFSFFFSLAESTFA